MSLHMKPRSDERQRIERYSLKIEPECSLDEDIDMFGNVKHIFDIHHPHSELSITSNARVEKTLTAELPNSLDENAWHEIRSWKDSWKLWEFLQPSTLTRTTADLQKWTEHIGGLDTSDPLLLLRSLETRLFEVIEYKPGKTSIDSTIDEVLEARVGVCQDISQLMIAIARSFGIPSRYVSGYLYVEQGTRNHVVDNATHAWLECLLPKIGWCSFDPTNPGSGDDSKIVVGYGRDYRDVPPTRGVTLGEGEADLEVDVVVLRSAVNHGVGADQQSSLIKGI